MSGNRAGRGKQAHREASAAECRVPRVLPVGAPPTLRGPGGI